MLLTTLLQPARLAVRDKTTDPLLMSVADGVYTVLAVAVVLKHELQPLPEVQDGVEPEVTLPGIVTAPMLEQTVLLPPAFGVGAL
jgi:hypothetical protein